MSRKRRERTIAQPCEVNGRGYWSGQHVTVRFCPAPEGTGIVFVRTDLAETPRFNALVDYRETMALRTVLRNASGASVSMVEHLLAALAGLQIDNCVVESNAEEMPGLDGSAAPFVEVLQQSGIVDQCQELEPYVIDCVIRVGTAANWIEASPNDNDCLEVEYRLDYGESCPIPVQTANCEVVPDSFCKNLAVARTFVTAEQAEQLRSRGVGQHVTTRDLLIFDREGLVENELLFANECARHKALDMVGDLALTGFPLIGKIVSYRGGHDLNALMAAKLRALSHRAFHQRLRTA